MKKILIFCGLLLSVFFFITEIKTRAQTRRAVSGAEVTGTFREKASGSEFSILALGQGKLKIAFSGVYPYKTANGEATANMGQAMGEAQIAGDEATFTPEDTEECTITLKFLTRGRLKVTQIGTDAECGFGHNVSADGSYNKVSSKKPKFDLSN
ncbi:MAG: hypothetical protein M3033_00105 [Acidobacteriota bacterium]|nr:hypothetical protein [Acidobacteriota bacterium]